MVFCQSFRAMTIKRTQRRTVVSHRGRSLFRNPPAAAPTMVIGSMTRIMSQ